MLDTWSLMMQDEPEPIQEEEFEDRLLRTAEACRFLGIHQTTIYRWVRQGLLPAIRLPTGEIRFQKSEIDLLITHGRLIVKKPRRREIPKHR